MVRHGMTIAPTRLGALGAALLCSLAAAQEAGTPEALDQMIEDVNPLSTSLRNVEFGLREPNSFDQVIRIGGPGGKLMRVQGALFALFDQSVYVTKGKAVHTEIPGGTVFWIGEPPSDASAEPPPEPRRYSGRIETIIAPLRFGNGPRAPEQERASSDDSVLSSTAGQAVLVVHAPEGRIVWDDDYRGERLRALMHSAAQAVGARQAR